MKKTVLTLILISISVLASAQTWEQVKKDIPELDVVAEDLGAVNDRVRALLKGCGYPGMRVMQFGFDHDETNPHILENHVENS